MNNRHLRAIAASALALIIGACATPPPPSAEPPADPLAHSPGALAVPAGDPLTLPSDEASLLAGRRLYVEHCVTCHGAGGRGDDLYVADTGQAIPDLTMHMAPGVHTDSQVLTYVRDGISGTSMPGYGLLFSETELLQIVAYVRTFAQDQPIVGVDPAALATEQARPPTPTPIPDVREALPNLVFVRDNTVFRSDEGSLEARPIAALAAGDVAQFPAFAPDGRQVAFVGLALPATSDDPLISTLYLSNSDGGEPQVIWQSSSEQMRHPFWAPDGSAIFATVYRGEQRDDGSYTQQTTLVQIEVPSGRLTQVRSDARDLAMSNDGRQWVFVPMKADGFTAGLIVSAAGANERVLIPDGVFEEIAAPRFSPDGGTIIFAARGEPLDGSSSGMQNSWLDWLGTAMRVPTASAHGTPWDIWAIPTGGGDFRRLTQLYEDEPHAVFSPDGGEIAIFGISGLYRMDSDGSGLRRLDPNGGYGGLDWAQP